MTMDTFGPRKKDRPSWDEYFLTICKIVSYRSPDPNTQHGCVLVDDNNRIVSTGYNGPISGLSHDVVDFTRPGKYHFFIHAEDNAVAFARCDLRNATAYITGEPCIVCFRRLAQCGIRRIVHGGLQSASITEDEKTIRQLMADSLGIEIVDTSTMKVIDDE